MNSPQSFFSSLTAYRLVGIIELVARTAKDEAAEGTRHKILVAAFQEFYRHGFQGGSLNHIVEMAGATKGAVFHYFAGKQELGYAVVDELIGPLLKARWLDPVAGSTNPLPALKRAFRQFVKEDAESG